MRYWTVLFVLLTLGSPLFAQLETGLVSRYYFNDGTAKDNFGPNDGINVDAIPVRDRFDNPRSAMYFDGNGYIDLGDEPFRMAISDFSVSFWMKLDEFTFRGYPIVKRITDPTTNEPSSWGIKFQDNGRDMEVQVAYDDLSQDEFALANIPDLEWHHFVIIYDRTGDLTLYIDKFLVDQNEIKTSFFQTLGIPGASLFLGRDQEETEYFIGTIDDIRVYRRALRGSDVDLLFNEAYIPVSTSELTDLDLAKHIYPNPAIETMQFTNPTQMEAEFIVTNSMAEKMLQGQISPKSSTQIAVANWPSGMYTLQMRDTKGGISATRFVVTRL
ncbi:MAG: T9SS type A sorting domain-containing protein, partial [Saprospiraceae bacterium]|nr:T9SS type A sorting domain-containing protein [Saprospiraceae bacterium]